MNKQSITDAKLHRLTKLFAKSLAEKILLMIFERLGLRSLADRWQQGKGLLDHNYQTKATLNDIWPLWCALVARSPPAYGNLDRRDDKGTT